MCFGYCVVSSLLSAVAGSMVVLVVCGVGHLIMLRLIMAALSELDYLI